MSFSVAPAHNASFVPPLSQQLSAPSTRIQQLWDFVCECIIKECGSCVRHLWYRLLFWIDPHQHRLNPTSLQRSDGIAKVLLLIHGAGAHPSSFLPLAQRLSEVGIGNLFTLALHPTKVNPVPIETVAARVQEIFQKYVQHGYRRVEFGIIGHSLGALVGSKYIWRGRTRGEETHLSLLISIAGRLNYIPNRFSWFCEAERSDIEETFEVMCSDPNRVSLYTIWGDQDEIVPKQSAHIQRERRRELTVKGWGHGGVIFAPETLNQVTAWVANWVRKKDGRCQRNNGS